MLPSRRHMLVITALTLGMAAAVAMMSPIHAVSKRSTDSDIDCVVCKALYNVREGAHGNKQAMADFCSGPLDRSTPARVRSSGGRWGGGGGGGGAH